MIKTYAEHTVEGRGKLRLKNGTTEAVTVEGIGLAEGGHALDALCQVGPMHLEGQTEQTIDITRTLLALFDRDTITDQTKRIRISLDLSPGHHDQPLAGDFEVSIKDNHITRFRASRAA
jgi:hypothetical protein